MKSSTVLVALCILGGVALLVAMVARVGLAGLQESLQAMGPWLFPYLLLRLVPFTLDAAAWKCCFPRDGAVPRLWHLLLVSRAGHAINQIVPTATIGGEVVRVLLLQHLVSRVQATVAVVIDKTSGTLAKMGYLTLGLLYLTQRVPLPTALQVSASITIGSIVLGLVGFMAFQRSGTLGKLTAGLGRWLRHPDWLQRWQAHVVPLDAQFALYYRRQPGRFLAALGLHFIADLFQIVKTYILLRLLLGDTAPGLSEAAMVAVVTSALDQMFFFVPGRVGTLEGARFVALSMLGVSEIYALAFGLIARVEQLVWSALELLAYTWRRRLLAAPGAGATPQRLSDNSHWTRRAD